jgi:molybdopterin molybdotransferase
MLPFRKAQDIIRQYSQQFGTEKVALSESWGRVLAEEIRSDRDYPPFNRATMDGFAIRLQDFETGIKNFEVVEEIFAGKVATKILATGQCYKIMTGAPVPASADCVIRREDVEELGKQAVINVNNLKYFQNIARQGEDLKNESLILSSGLFCKAPEINVMAVVGKTQPIVHKLPKVALFSTGDEVIESGKAILPHQIRDSNSFVLEAMLRKFQITPVIKQLVPDSISALEKAFSTGLACDVVIVSGGVSAGDADYVPGVMEKLGVKKVFHKVAIRPGKPFWFGQMPNAGVVFALPGNPVSCQVNFKLFIEPFLYACWQMPETSVQELPLLSSKTKKVSLDEFFPVKLTSNGLQPIHFNTSGDITATLGSDGIALHPTDKGDLEEKESVNFWLW